MIRSNEPRVGQDRSISSVQQEARDFLRQLRSDDVIKSDVELQSRTEVVALEIEQSSKHVPVGGRLPNEIERTSFSDGGQDGLLAGGPWKQTTAELEHGVRLAWKHSSKCIMRSEYLSLEICDLRHVTTSRDMGLQLLRECKRAFNLGAIRPTVFMFPPRQPGQRGPMIWNSNLLAFAGWENADGTVLGDPANVDVTKAMLELGWAPPRMRTRWDLLPLVTMAEGDEPMVTPIHEDDFPLVRITHPEYDLQFERLGLRWAPAPVLSRLGFDIGGVQYTAAPFIGWFMDAEIGVRNLADRQRYNVLPRVAAALGCIANAEEADRVSEHQRLRMLSRAQAELNYAVLHSFSAAGVMMSDSLTASNMYCNFDDQHERSKGFRLPANPYWIAPPQGSIVPIWHRGGAPNYQPTPLVCRHVQNPIKAWRRESRQQESRFDSVIQSPTPSTHGQQRSHDSPLPSTGPMIHIHYCTAAMTAKRLADELHRRISGALANDRAKDYSLYPVTVLNELRPASVARNDKVLVVASTAGRGEIPLNGRRIQEMKSGEGQASSFHFAVFGNGSSTYGDTYNNAAKTIEKELHRCGAVSLGTTALYHGDTAVEDPPWSQFDKWTGSIIDSLGLRYQSERVRDNEPGSIQAQTSKARMEQYRRVKIAFHSRLHGGGVFSATLDVGSLPYGALSHVSILVPNPRRLVRKALQLLRMTGHERVASIGDLTAHDFLQEFVDFDSCFISMDWAVSLRLSPSRRKVLAELPVHQAMQAIEGFRISGTLTDDLFFALPLRTPRTYSCASSPELQEARGHGQRLELMIQLRPGGLVSSYLLNAAIGSCLRLKVTETKWRSLLEAIDKPVICFATGSGIAPVQSLLQYRLAALENGTDIKPAPITLMLGFRIADSDVIANAILDATAAGLVDICLLTPSNKARIRTQDRIFGPTIRDQLTVKLRHEDASVLVCANATAAEEFASNLSSIVGCDVPAALGSERYVQEVFKHAAS